MLVPLCICEDLKKNEIILYFYFHNALGYNVDYVLYTTVHATLFVVGISAILCYIRVYFFH